MAASDVVVESQISAMSTELTDAINSLKSQSWTFVDARTDASAARPTGWAGVIWLADDTGNPTNAVTPDIIVREDLTVV